MSTADNDDHREDDAALAAFSQADGASRGRAIPTLILATARTLRAALTHVQDYQALMGAPRHRILEVNDLLEGLDAALAPFQPVEFSTDPVSPGAGAVVQAGQDAGVDGDGFSTSQEKPPATDTQGADAGGLKCGHCGVSIPPDGYRPTGCKMPDECTLANKPAPPQE